MDDLVQQLSNLERGWRMPRDVRDATWRRGRRLSARLNALNEQGVQKVVVGGSFAKGLETVFTDDLDLYSYIDFATPAWQKAGSRLGPEQALERLEGLLADTFWAPIRDQRVYVRPQQHSVGLRYSDAPSLAFDVVPLAHRRGTPSWVELPRRGSGQWVKTSIRRQMTLLTERAKMWRGLRGGIRLLKIWKKHLLPAEGGEAWSSYAFEVMAMHVTSGLTRSASAGDVFLATLRWIDSTRLRSAVDLARWSPRKACPTRPAGIFDPAHMDNDLTPTPRMSARHVLVGAAVETLSRLNAHESVSRGAVAEVFGVPCSQGLRRSGSPHCL